MTLRIAVINPTSINSNADKFHEVPFDLALVAETSATLFAQRCNTKSYKKMHMQPVWGHPVPSQRIRCDSFESVRGMALGVCNFARPSVTVRHARNVLPDTWLQTCRVMVTFMQLPTTLVRVVTVYGVQPSAHQASQKNLSLWYLLREIIGEADVPTLIGGDFNLRPQSLDLWKEFVEHGYSETFEFVQRTRGVTLPHTCRGATSNDTLIFSRHFAPHFLEAQVLSDGWFAAHDPLVVTFKMSTFCYRRLSMPMPDMMRDDILSSPVFAHFQKREAEQLQSRSDFDLSVQGDEVTHDMISLALAKVAETFESAYDKTIDRLNQLRTDDDHVPKRVRRDVGRLRPRKPTQVPNRQSVRCARNGDFEPCHETYHKANVRLVKQVRRIEALLRRLRKHHLQGILDHDQDRREWFAICNASSFAPCFQRWCFKQNLIDIWYAEVPGCDWLSCLLDRLRVFTDDAILHEKNIRQKQFRHRVDLDNLHFGGSLTAALIKDKHIDRPTSFEITRSGEVTRMRSLAKGPPILDVHNFPGFEMQAQTFAGEEELKFHAGTSPGQIVVTNLPKDLGGSFQLKQKQFSSDPSEVARAFFEYWAPFWLRDSGDQLTCLDEWSNFLDLCQHVPDLELGDVSTKHTVDEWIWSIRNTKRDTARGVCGFACQELIAMEPCLVQQLIDIFHHSRGCGLPPWMMVSKVFLVPKTCDATSIDQMRPITVMSLVLRIWSKTMARRLLQQWKHKLPPNIVGAMPERSCSQLTLTNAVIVEHRLQLAWDAGGFSLDISKCFNGFPRLPLRYLLSKGGLDEGHASFWSESIKHLTRCACLLDSISMPSPTTTGAAEGDPMSVCAMILVGFAWRSILSSATSVRTSIFADDWSWEGFTVEQHVTALKLTMQFLESLKLQSDPRKCWSWGLTPKARKIWKEVNDFLFGNPLRYKISIAERELGVCMHYAKVTRHGCSAERLKTGIQRLEKLRRLPLGAQRMAHMMVTCIWPMALFGSDTVYIGNKHFEKLRSLATEILVVKTKATLNHLAINMTVSNMVDPLFYVISRALTLWRRMLIRDPSNCDIFYHVLGCAGDDPNKAYGPASALKCYLALIGWSIDMHAVITTSNGCSFNLCTISPRSLVHHLWSAWDLLVTQSLRKRDDFSDWPCVDIRYTKRVPQPEDPRYNTGLGTLRSLGTLFTTQRKHWQNSDEWDNEFCPLCGCEDSRVHFPFQCPGTHDLRLAHANTLARARDEFPHMCFLPVMHKHPHMDMLEWLHDQREMPEPFDMPTLPDDLVPVFYTDGSSAFPTHPAGGLASWAIIMDKCTADAARVSYALTLTEDALPQVCFAPIQIALGVGQQTINRVELQAIIQIIRSSSSAVIYADSPWAIDVKEEVTAEPNYIVHAHKQNSDLYFHLCQLAHSKDLNQFCCRKVQAHQDVATISDPIQRYHAIANNYVDKLAKRGVERTQSSVHAASWDVAMWYERQQHLLEHVSTFLIHAHCLRLDAFQNKKEPSTDNLPSSKFSFANGENWMPDGAVAIDPVVLPDKLLQAFLPGAGILKCICDWCMRLEWPTTDDDTGGISWYELSVNFVGVTGSTIPRQVDPSVSHGAYTDPRYSDSAALLPVGPWDMTKILQSAVGFVAKYHGREIMPVSKQKKRWYLGQLGYAKKISGFEVRPRLPRQDVHFMQLAKLVNSEGLATPIPFDIEFEGPRETSPFDHLPHMDRYRNYRNLGHCVRKHGVVQ